MQLTQEQYDYVIARFQDAVAKTEKMIPRIDTLEQSKDYQQRAIEGIAKVVSDHSDGTADNFSKADKKSEDIRSSIRQIDLKYQPVFDLFSQVNATIETYKNELSDRIKLVSGSVSCTDSYLKEQIDKVKKEFPSRDSRLTALENTLSEQTASSATKYKSHESKINSLWEQSSAHTASVSRVEDSFKLHQLSIQRSIESVTASTTKQISDAVSQISQQVSAIQMPVVPSLEDAKKAFKDQLESIALDSKNAHIRSENSEKRMNLLEKKIEQLTLLIKNIQLGA